MADRESRKRIKEYCGPHRMITVDELGKLDAAGGYVCEEKHDGEWCLVTVTGSTITAMASRVGLAFSGTKADGLLGLGLGMPTHTARLVGELVADRVDGRAVGTRRLNLFDVIDWNGNDLRSFPLTKRRAFLTQYAAAVKPVDRVKLTPQLETGFVAHYEAIIARAGEGVVVKAKDSLYQPRRASGKIDAWVRCKPQRTVDYVVTGHGVAEKGTPKVELSLYKQTKAGRKLVRVGSVTVLSIPDSAASLVGKIVECEGYEIFPSGMIRHAHLTRVRDDKDPADCTYEAAMRG